MSANPLDTGVRLATKQVTVSFQGLRAVDGVDFDLGPAEILGLIGPNGAGKTTLLNTLSGFQQPSNGTVTLGTLDITGWSAPRIAALGIGRTFQGGRLFKQLTVLENVQVAAVSTGMSLRSASALARQLLTRLELEPHADLLAATLPYGLARRLGVARALGLRPNFLLLDEPAAGLNEQETEQLTTVLRELRDQDGMGLLVIEHDVPMIMSVCDRVHVLDHGKSLAVGTPEQISSDTTVRTAYLGGQV